MIAAVGNPNTTGPPRRCRSRQGLAPLELVLALPILLLIMALMVNFGTVASWKVRALGVARHSAWGNRWPRSTASFPRPACWPPTADTGTSNLPPASELDGPRVTSPSLGPPGNIVANTGDPDTDVMNPTLGLVEGNAHLTRPFPMFGKLGRYDLTAQTQLLENKWEYSQMKWAYQQRRLRSNNDFRIPVVYVLAAPRFNQQAWAQAYVRARQTILGALFPYGMATPGPLWSLDRDAEFAYYGSLGLSPQSGNRSPDFHPLLGNFSCSADPTEARAAIGDLISRIQGSRNPRSLARRMTGDFISLYQYVISNYQSVTGRHLPPGVQQQLQQDIAALQQFQATL